MEGGILKLNQRVISEIILEDSPGAITVRYAIDSIKDIINAGTATDLSDNLTPIECKPIWAVDLTDTYMSAYDFNVFIQEMGPFFPQLEVLILSTVNLNEISVEHLMLLMEGSCFKHLVLCGTFYTNIGIVRVLESISRTNRSKDLSLKLIFALKSYCKRLDKDIKWIEKYIQTGLLHPDWYLTHAQYYDTVEPVIKQAKAIQLLTGDSDYDGDHDIDSELEDISDSMQQLSMIQF